MSEKQKVQHFDKIRRSKLGRLGVGLAVTSMAVLGVAELGSDRPGSSIIPKDKIVQVENGSLVPEGFRAIHASPEEISKEIQGASRPYNFIVARDKQGHEGVYQFSFPGSNGVQNVVGVADSLKEISNTYVSENSIPPGQYPAEVISVKGSERDTANYIEEESTQGTDLYLLVQPPHNSHPIAFEVGSPGAIQITNDLLPQP